MSYQLRKLSQDCIYINPNPAVTLDSQYLNFEGTDRANMASSKIIEVN